MNAGIIIRRMPKWEKIIWGVIALYLLAVFIVFWSFGFSKIAFPI